MVNGSFLTCPIKYWLIYSAQWPWPFFLKFELLFEPEGRVKIGSCFMKCCQPQNGTNGSGDIILLFVIIQFWAYCLYQRERLTVTHRKFSISKKSWTKTRVCSYLAKVQFPVDQQCFFCKQRLISVYVPETGYKTSVWFLRYIQTPGWPGNKVEGVNMGSR